jgi:hypothetical protein
LLPLTGSRDPAARYHFDPRDPAGWAIVAGLSVLFGSILGAAFFDPKPRRRWVPRRQRVTGRVHPPAA